MITIDGSQGEGGGQILRSALSLSAITGRGVHFTNIRARRPRPGLMRQHLACVKAVAEICDGDVAGAELNSQELVFKPGRIRSGDFRFVIGSAGSVLLLAQAVLPVLLLASGPSEVILEGGTYNTTESPSYDFFAQAFLSCLSKMGLEVTSEMARAGFCPAGGGSIRLSVKPARAWREFSLCERGELRDARVTALGSDLEHSILTDELAMFQAGLGDMMNFRPEARCIPADCPGNALFSTLEYENITELFGTCGSYGISRQSVARRVIGLTKQYLANKWVVGQFLADQLLLPLALGRGGVFLTGQPTLHSETNRAVIRQFLDVEINFKQYNSLYEMEVIK